jgi:hypothetical protein
MLEICFKIVDAILPAFFNSRRLLVFVHRAYFVGSGQECFVINLTNCSSRRDLEVTHVWFQGAGRIPVLQPERPLPVRLKPDQCWQTWLPVAALPQVVLPEALTLGRARLSTGAVVCSKPNTNVPNDGIVPADSQAGIDALCVKARKAAPRYS